MGTRQLKARVLALYLPQFHPIQENDEWWGKGFTEWTNVGKAKSLFPGHYQPHVPADLGYYDLRVPETREAQAQLAREAGVEGFQAHARQDEAGLQKTLWQGAAGDGYTCRSRMRHTRSSISGLGHGVLRPDPVLSPFSG